MSQCICNQGYFGGGSWDGFTYPKCIKKIQCKCPNGVAATNIPCGKSHTRNCPIIDNKGNLISTFIGKQEEIKIKESIANLGLETNSPEKIINAAKR